MKDKDGITGFIVGIMAVVIAMLIIILVPLNTNCGEIKIENQELKNKLKSARDSISSLSEKLVFYYWKESAISYIDTADHNGYFIEGKSGYDTLILPEQNLTTRGGTLSEK